jgi:hypothetical protein
MATQATTGTARIVWAGGNGPLDQVEVIDDRTKQPKLDQQGNKMYERSFGLALSKTDPSFATIWAAMAAEAQKVCNGVVPPFPNNGVFAYKLTDGDGMDKGDIAKGRQPQPYSKREGYAGCWVLTIKSALPNPPPVYDWVNGQWQQIDPNNIRGGNKLKVGDYVQVGLNIDGHAGQSPGLYLNPQGIQFVGFGTAIMRGPDASAMFGAGPPPVPTGASATPVGPGGAPMAPTAPPMPGSPTPPPSAPAMPGSTPAMPGAPGAVPSPGNSAPMPGSSPGMQTASPSSPPGMPAAPLPGFHAGQPGVPAPAPAAPPAPPAPPQRVQAGIDAAGRPYFYKADGSGQTEY